MHIYDRRGHVEPGEWRFRAFIVNDLNEDEEHRNIMDWVGHTEDTANRFGVSSVHRLFHWAPAEVAQLARTHNSAHARHGSRADCPADLSWVDFYKIMERGR